MTPSKKIGLGLISAMVIAGCGSGSTKAPVPTVEPAVTVEQNTMEDNILLQEWTGPYGGVPAF